MRGGRRSTANARPPAGIDTGAVSYVDADGFVAWLEYPPGAALGDYVLVTGDDDIPVWMTAADFLGAAGASPDYAWLYMTTVDGSGATVLATDDDGTPILTYAPV